MKELTAYNVRTRKKCKIVDPKVVVLKNGRKAIKGLADDDRKTTVFRMVSDAEAKEFQQS
jgi:hypothetical protein